MNCSRVTLLSRRSCANCSGVMFRDRMAPSSSSLPPQPPQRRRPRPAIAGPPPLHRSAGSRGEAAGPDPARRSGGGGSQSRKLDTTAPAPHRTGQAAAARNLHRLLWPAGALGGGGQQPISAQRKPAPTPPHHCGAWRPLNGFLPREGGLPKARAVPRLRRRAAPLTALPRQPLRNPSFAAGACSAEARNAQGGSWNYRAQPLLTFWSGREGNKRDGVAGACTYAWGETRATRCVSRCRWSVPSPNEAAGSFFLPL